MASPVVKLDAYRREGILARERNLLTLYHHAAGKSEIPPSYHTWSLLSLVAASVGKRVSFSKFGHAALYPNLYIFLIGPSGLGKGAAMAYMLQMEHIRHNILNGAATDKAMVTRFSTQAPADHPGYEQCWLLHEELGNSISPGPAGKAFIKFITDTHTRAGEYYTDATRKFGEVKFPKPCINWLAGSTPEWLGQSIDLEDMLSGFFGRVIGVPEWYNTDHRVYRPERHDPPDREEVIDYLCSRIDVLTKLPEGSTFEISRQAEDTDEDWYMRRAAPTDERMMPFWKRSHDLALKLAMVLSLCRDCSLQIEVEDIVKAHEFVEQAKRAMPTIIQWATMSQLSQYAKELESYMAKRQRWVRRSSVMDYMKKYGLTAKMLNEVIEELEARGSLEVRKSGGSWQYRYQEVAKLFEF